MAIPDDYDLIEQLSNNAGAQVWKARNPSEQSVVLKIAADEPRVLRRFARELSAMLDHANKHVVPILDYNDSRSWYAMPYAQSVLSATAVPCSLPECIEVLNAVAAGLRSLHAANQVHRDLKPHNILWLDDAQGARWVVADFGIVRNPLGLTTETLTHAGNLTGTTGWAAPEQYADAHEATIAADVYSLGAIAAWLLTGRAPSYGHVTMPTEPRLRAVINKATRPNPAARYADLDKFVDAFILATKPFVGTFEGLTQQAKWAEASEYILGQPEEGKSVMRALPKIPQATVNAWAKADSAGLADAVIDLIGEAPELSYREMDNFLVWCVQVTRALVSSKQFELAERVAEVLFGTTAQVDQSVPARAIRNWLAVLSVHEGEAMERALHSSESWEYFQAQARDKFENNTDSQLIRKLREG